MLITTIDFDPSLHFLVICWRAAEAFEREVSSAGWCPSKQEIRAVLLAAIVNGTVLDERKGKWGTMQQVHVRLHRAPKEDFEATILFGTDQHGNPVPSPNRDKTMVFVKELKPL